MLQMLRIIRFAESDKPGPKAVMRLQFPFSIFNRTEAVTLLATLTGKPGKKLQGSFSGTCMIEKIPECYRTDVFRSY